MWHSWYSFEDLYLSSKDKKEFMDFVLSSRSDAHPSWDSDQFYVKCLDEFQTSQFYVDEFTKQADSATYFREVSEQKLNVEAMIVCYEEI